MNIFNRLAKPKAYKNLVDYPDTWSVAQGMHDGNAIEQRRKKWLDILNYLSYLALQYHY
jgi:DNA-binding transcriptional regulator of glucitol operon